MASPAAPRRDDTADEIAAMLVEPILEDLPYGDGDSVLAFVNGMGGTPLIELYLMYDEVNQILCRPGHHGGAFPGRQLHHSLEMAGCSVTLLRPDDELLRLWDAPVKTPGLRWGV